jgi:phi13 family phage major tail protein
MTAQGEYKSTLGLRDLYYALVTQDDADAYAAGTPAYFAPAINANASPASNQQTQYADDGPYEVMTAEGSTAIELEVTGIPVEILALFLGKTYDAATGRMFDNGGTPPDVALSFRSVKSNGSYRYFQYLKGKFSAPGEEQATKTDTPDPKTSTITYTAVKTIYQFDLIGDASLLDGVKRVTGDEDATNFNGATWFAAVQVPSAGAPDAFTLTPVPADAAVGVVVSSNITLTFSNPLAGNAEDGIILTTAAGVPKACARTLNAARTIVTLNPTTDMAAATDYLIIVPGVTDIYSQTLADAVVNFTTA